MGGYLCCLLINNVTGLVVSWCLAPFIVDDGDICGFLVKVDLGKLVCVSIYFVPIVDEFGETGALGGLGKLLEVEIEVMDKDSVVGREPHLGELIFVLCYGRTVCAEAFDLLWCALMSEEACVGVLGPGLD